MILMEHGAKQQVQILPSILHQRKVHRILINNRLILGSMQNSQQIRLSWGFHSMAVR